MYVTVLFLNTSMKALFNSFSRVLNHYHLVECRSITLGSLISREVWLRCNNDTHHNVKVKFSCYYDSRKQKIGWFEMYISTLVLEFHTRMNWALESTTAVDLYYFIKLKFFCMGSGYFGRWKASNDIITKWDLD